MREPCQSINLNHQQLIDSTRKLKKPLQPLKFPRSKSHRDNEKKNKQLHLMNSIHKMTDKLPDKLHFLCKKKCRHANS